MWQRARSSSKSGFDKLYGWVDKLGPPVNNLSNRLGSEAFWPTTLDKECEKAARILRSFCKDGFQDRDEDDALARKSWDIETNAPRKNHTKVLKRIPQEVIQKAKGLAIFTTMRTGLWVSGAGGSGVLIARLPDGSWSCPSGIMLHTAGVGFLVGVDVYDCVVVLNTDEAVRAFSAIRCTVGGELSAVAGPIGVGGILESEVHKRQAPLFTYLKSRGLYAGVQLDGTIIIERSDENERFYKRRISVADILAGKILYGAPIEAQRLMQTIKMAQGDTDVEVSMLTTEAPPSDYDVATGLVFGVPDREDPDPYGFLALEKEGLVIREAGTRKAASRESFQFSPSPSSPLFSAFNQGWDRRASLDSEDKRSSWRASLTNTPEASSTTLVESATSSRPQSGSFVASMAGIPEMESIDKKLVDSPSHVTGQMDVTEAYNPAQLPSRINDISRSSEDQHQTLLVIPPTPSVRAKINFLPPPKTPSLHNKASVSLKTPNSERPRGPALPARPEKGHRILQEQFAMAEQLRELISPTPRADKASPFQELSPPPTPFIDALEKQNYQSTDASAETLHMCAPEVQPISTEVGNRQVVEDKFVDSPHSTLQHTPDLTESAGDENEVDADDENSDFSDDDDVVFHEVITTAAPRILNASPQFMAKARLVTVTMPSTPMLPSRNPNRVRASKSHAILRPDSVTLDRDQLSLHDEPRPDSRASSVYSVAKEGGVLSSPTESDSFASVSSVDTSEPTQLQAFNLAPPPAAAIKRSPSLTH